MNDFLTLIIYPILTGIFVSAIWLVGLRLLRPKIEICKSFTISKHHTDDSKELCVYTFKIINWRSRSAVNLRVELSLMTGKEVPALDPNGNKRFLPNSHAIPLKRSELFELPAYKKKDKDSLNSFRFSTDAEKPIAHDIKLSSQADLRDLEEVWANVETGHLFKPYLRLRILAIDEVSNYGKVFTQTFYREAGTEGEFVFGNTCEIVPRERQEPSQK